MSRSPSRREQAELSFNAGEQLLAQGDYHTAKSHFRESLALNPAYAAAHLGLARTERNLGDFSEAEESARAALQADPQNAAAAHFLGALLVELDRLSEGLPFLYAAVEWDPAIAQHHRDLGVTQLFLGDMEAGRASLLRTLERDVHSDEVLYTLVRMLHLGDDTPVARRVLSIATELAANEDSLPPKERAQVLFALGKAYQDRGEIVKSSTYYARGNAVRRALADCDMDKIESRYRRIADTFDKPLIERLSGQGARDARPIFIVGMPRSGSTLIEQILSAHPQVHGGGELFLLPPIVEGSTGKNGTRYPEWGPIMNAADCRTFGKTYLNDLPRGLPGKTRTTDKWLENFEYLGLISVALPDAAIIHCRRDPRDQLFSCWTTLFASRLDYAYEIGELTRSWNAYRRLMSHWRKVLPAGRMLEVPYEELVGDAEGWARRIIGHCNLEWDEQVMRFWEARRSVRSASLAQVRKPIYARSIGQWKPFADAMAPLFEAIEAGRAE
jgi:Tfp pilus assembly protein PilF